MTKLAALLLAGVVSASGRTWTSADESRVVEGNFKGFNAEEKLVSIEVEGQVVTFDLDKLSEKDQSFVKSQTKEVDMKAIVSKAPLHRLVDGKFADAKFESEPEYYLVYFSASW